MDAETHVDYFYFTEENDIAYFKFLWPPTDVKVEVDVIIQDVIWLRIHE